MSARVAALASLVLVCACDLDLTGFGKPCGRGESCGADAPRCVEGVCVPLREVGDAGEDCGNALEFAENEFRRESAPLVREISFAGARADYPTSCGGDATADVVVVFTVPTGTAPFPVRIRAELADAVISLRRVADDGACALELPDACVVNGDLLVEYVDAATWAVVISARGTAAESVRVIVEPIDCPAGYLPFGDDACAGFRAVPAPSIARTQAVLVALPDGRAALSGGLEAGTGALPDSELFEPTSETWTYLPTFARTPPHAAVVAGENLIIIGGGVDAEILTEERGEDVLQLLEIAPVGGGPDVIDHVAPQLAAGLPSGALVVLTDYGDYLLHVDQEVDGCTNNICTNPEGFCVADNSTPSRGNICMCPNGPCLSAPQLGGTITTTGARDNNVATNQRPIVGGTRRGQEYVTVHDVDTVYEIHIASGHWRQLSVASRVDVRLSSLNTGVLIVGGRITGLDRRVEGRPTARVELADANLQARESLGELRHARVQHGQAVLPDGRVLVVGGTGRDGRALASAELIDPAAGTVSRLPRLPKPATDVQAVTLADGRVLAVGAIGDDHVPTDAWMFETVARGQAPPPAPGEPCGLILDVEPNVSADPTAASIFEETTVGERDRFRDASCSADFETVGPERLFSFTIGEARSLTVGTNLGYATLLLRRAPCLPPTPLGCTSVTRDDASPLGSHRIAPSLPPDTYILVVEAHDRDDRGVGFALDLRLDAPTACARDDHDPSDDDPANARRLIEVPYPPNPEPPHMEVGTGILCGDDVDHVIIERWASASTLWLEDAARDTSTIQLAVFDDAATLAAGEPIYTFGDAVPFGDGATEPAILLVALRSGTGDLFQHHWQLIHSPDTCVPEDVDSLAPALDDANNPARRTPLPASGQIDRCLTSDVDVDVTVMAAPADLDLIVSITGRYQLEAQLYALSAPDAPLGAAIGAPIPDDTFGIVEAGIAPYIAIVTRTSDPAGEEYHLSVEAADLSAACDAATPLADTGTWSIDSTLFAPLLDPEDFGDCTTYPERGSDALGTLVLSDGDVLNAELEPDGSGDVAVYLLTSCIIGTPACVAGADSVGDGDTEELTYQHAGPDQRYYLAADSYYVDDYTATLRWNVTRAGQ